MCPVCSKLRLAGPGPGEVDPKTHLFVCSCGTELQMRSNEEERALAKSRRVLALTVTYQGSRGRKRASFGC